MFLTAILVGLYGYLILFLGVLGFLSKQIIFTATLIFIIEPEYLAALLRG